jgi:hypothetical protein
MIGPMFYGPFYGDESQAVTYWVPEVNLPELRTKLDKLANKARRLGVGTITYAIGEPENRPYVRYQTEDGSRYSTYESLSAEMRAKLNPANLIYFRFFPVAVTGTTPRLGGWSFVATLQHLKDDTGATLNLLRVVPGFMEKLPESYRHADASNCDHCCRTIRTRKDTFIVRNDATGEYQQVGRHCTQDFLGGKDPHAVAAFLESLFHAQAAAEEMSEGSFGGGRQQESYNLSAFLTQVAAVVRVFGWVSRGKARAAAERGEGGLTATADVVLEVLGPPPFGGQARAEWNKLREQVAPIEADKLLAEAALDYAREVLSNKPDRDDYEHNLYVATTQPAITPRLAGITASLIPYHLRNVERMTERATAVESQHVGIVGERSDFVVKTLKVIPIETDYGTSFLHKFITADGNLLTWFASTNPEVEIGKEYQITAMVKKHDEYKGVKQTGVSRVVVWTEEGRRQAEEKAAKKAEKEAKKAERESKRAAAAMAKAAKAAAKAAKAGGGDGSGLGSLPPDAVEHYMRDDADVFALALHHELGFQPVAVRGYFRTDDGQMERETAHVAAALPDGRVVDASGVMHPEEMLDVVGWYFFSERYVEELRIEPISVEEAANTFGPPPSYAEVADAREYVRLMFDEGR